MRNRKEQEFRKKRPTKTPTYKCDNCKCMRYVPCGCMKKQSKVKKEEKAIEKEAVTT